MKKTTEIKEVKEGQRPFKFDTQRGCTQQIVPVDDTNAAAELIVEAEEKPPREEHLR